MKFLLLILLYLIQICLDSYLSLNTLNYESKYRKEYKKWTEIIIF